MLSLKKVAPFKRASITSDSLFLFLVGPLNVLVAGKLVTKIF